MANTTGYRDTKTFSYLEESDYCSHCSATDLSKAVGYFYEDDSCGPVFRHIVCAECRDSIKAAQDDQPTTCHDCKQTVKVKDTIEWRWYDFYAAQGDEPLVICAACQQAEHHVKRVERDRADYEHEFPHRAAGIGYGPHHGDPDDIHYDDEEDDDDIDDEPEDDALDPEDDIPEEHWDDLR